MSNRKVVLTPITLKVKRRVGIPCPRKDYREQQARNQNDDSLWCWDDASTNKAKKGDAFIFWDRGEGLQSGDFIFHQVKEVRDPSNRLKSWADNVGQGNRNVLELSEPKFTLTYSEFIGYGGNPNHQGTYYPKAGFGEGSEMMRLINESFE